MWTRSVTFKKSFSKKKTNRRGQQTARASQNGFTITLVQIGETKITIKPLWYVHISPLLKMNPLNKENSLLLVHMAKLNWLE